MSLLESLRSAIEPGTKEEKFVRKYNKEREIAQSSDRAARLKLAKDKNTQAEILYYLAQHDSDSSIRTAVAANNSTPFQANKIIVADKSADVRLALAERLTKLLPDLSDDQQSMLYAYTIEALEALASDEMVKIRIVLAQTFKNQLFAPPHIVNQLARDIEREVAEPILQYCMNVSDDVLLDILANHPASWKIEAIAQRKYIGDTVSDAVIETYHEQGGVLLLDNREADISKPTLFKIVEKAKVFTAWQKPVAVRAFLPSDVAKKLAEFVDESVRNLIAKRTDLDKEITQEIGEKFREDLNELERQDNERMSPEDRVRKLIADKALNEDTLIGALESRERVFAIVILAALARTSRSNMESVIGTLKPKAIVAVCWRAGVSMRTCLRIQQELVKIPSKELIYPRGGTDYPMDEAEIKWQLDFFGLK